MRIRPALDRDLPLLRVLEKDAGVAFRDIGMGEIADHEPIGLDALAAFRRAGRAWVTVDPAAPAGESDVPMAYLVADVVDGNLHVEQVSVHPRYARRRLGRALLDHAEEHAVAHGMPALTLTTFLEVPWNAPYYTWCGFRVLADSEVTPGLREVLRREAAHGLHRWPRVGMLRPTSGEVGERL